MGAPIGNRNAAGSRGGIKGKGLFLKRGRIKSRLSKLDSRKSLLLRQANKLTGIKKRLYPHPDITSPMSPKEKKLTGMIAKKFSEINRVVEQKNKYKRK